MRKAEKDGKTIGNVKVKFMRNDPSSLRPNELEVTFTIDDKQETRFFENKVGGGGQRWKLKLIY